MVKVEMRKKRNFVSACQYVEESEIKVAINPKTNQPLFKLDGLTTSIALIFSGKSSIENIPFVAVYYWDVGPYGQSNESEEELLSALSLDVVDRALQRALTTVDSKMSRHLRQDRQQTEKTVADLVLHIDQIVMVGGQKPDTGHNFAGSEKHVQLLKEFFVRNSENATMRAEFEKNNYVKLPGSTSRNVNTEDLLCVAEHEYLNLEVRLNDQGKLFIHKDVRNIEDTEEVYEGVEQPRNTQAARTGAGQVTATRGNISWSAPALEVAPHNRTIKFTLFPPDATAKIVLGLEQQKRARDFADTQEQETEHDRQAKMPRTVETSSTSTTTTVNYGS